MKILSYAAASAVALVVVPAPATAQHMNMPGMTMPMPAKKSPAKKTVKKAVPKKTPTAKTPTAAKAPPKNATPLKNASDGHADHSSAGMAMPMDHSQMEHGTTQMPVPTQPGDEQKPRDRSLMDHGEMGQMNMPIGEHAGHEMAMAGALGPYPMQRESSGTAWQPDSSEHSGLMVHETDWMLMAHGVLNLVYDHQSGPRGDDKFFTSGMLMAMARRPLGNGTLQLKAMVSPDPLMGPRGYPLLLASGETANGSDRLIDRQHPHDFFMELSGSVSQNIGAKSSGFIYAALPGEPAFGPPAFMHREAIMDSPEAPITHHWLDSTHISFGVVTAGLVLDRIKVEVSRFNGREPDQHRWNIETGPLDSTSVRLSWNPTRTLSLQGSWGHFTDPEQLEPGVDQKRWSASALWADEIARGWKAAATLAWGRKVAEGHKDDAVALEGSLKHDQWTLFSRAEMTENRELLDVTEGPAFRVGKVSAGAVRDFRIADHLSLGAGGVFSLNFVPDELAALYGGAHPTGGMAFVRIRLH